MFSQYSAPHRYTYGTLNMPQLYLFDKKYFSIVFLQEKHKIVITSASL